MGVLMRLLAVRTAAMTCPFLSRLPSQFVKNYSSKLLKTYGEHCPVVSQGASQTLAAPGPLARDPALCQEGASQGVSKCPMGGAALHTQSSGLSPVRQVAATVDDIEERFGFNYESFFEQQIQKKKMDHSYRVFKKVSRDATNFPAAREFSWGKKEITVWCSNDYLGMSAHPKVTGAVMDAVMRHGVGAGDRAGLTARQGARPGLHLLLRCQ